MVVEKIELSDYKKTKIYIAGHGGMVGSAVWRTLKSKGYSNLIGKTSAELDLLIGDPTELKVN